MTHASGIVNESLQHQFYTAEPIWLRNERSESGRRSGSMHFPLGNAFYPVNGLQQKAQPHRVEFVFRQFE